MMWKSLLFNTAFAVNCLLAFLLLFETGLSIPPWLQVFGRIHPLFLHIPIGILLLYAIAETFFSFKKFSAASNDLRDGLLLISAVTISLTALMGLFLSRETAYEPEAVFLHKWAGSIVSFLLLAWYQWRIPIRKSAVANKSIAVLSIVFITIAGHMGGNITHGENFVLAPVLPKDDEYIPPMDEAVVFRHMVQPILKEKCVSCHNESKAKGELVMETTELLLKGGKDGILWDTAAADLGLLMRRVNLPLNHDDHMPPKGKVQLTDMERTILEAWIRTGSDLTIKVVELPAGDTLKSLAADMFTEKPQEVFTFEEAEQNVVESLNNFYRIVKPLADNSPALAVSFYGRRQFTPQLINELKPINAQIVEMDLSRMPVKDEQLADIAGFPNLRKLVLNFTDITGTGLQSLQKLNHLRELSLSGTEITRSSLDALQSFPSLEKVYLWNTPALADGKMLPQSQNKKLQYETGFYGDTMILKLTPPIFNNELAVFSEATELKLKHNVNGTEIRYTLDGSEPDSIGSPVFKNDVIIDKAMLVKARAFRKGWLSSDVSRSPFFISAIKPEKIKLLTSPDRKYIGSKERTLFDFALGGTNVDNGKWLGYQSPSVMEIMIELPEESGASSITLSCYQQASRHIFLPETIAIWYGKDSSALTLLEIRNIAVPEQDTTNDGDLINRPVVIKLPEESVRYIKLKATPLTRFPKWHQAKGDRSWLFIDEVSIN